MIDIIAGVLLFGSAAILFTILAIMFASELLAGRAVKQFLQDGDMRDAWQAQMDDAWALTINEAKIYQAGFAAAITAVARGFGVESAVLPRAFVEDTES